jgi:hypothetical protein
MKKATQIEINNNNRAKAGNKKIKKESSYLPPFF